ncbi:unnamed protein product [Clonostachys byssicola]|uniref:Interferon-induced GTP-binding protein Mx n=1 Tax=Clonostachys byssicola TaxID=160290 RepID=A0A9N9U3F1_9HYPO|nr:unnamed protein product [Clonostachys byssicola]
MEVSINSQILDELNTKEARELHETINSLRAYGVDRIVNLPQIIVVGDQSSGKSSVLEALCHVRFPVKDGLCTRFATELVLQPAAATNVKATVRYFGQTKAPLVVDTSGFDDNDLPSIIEEAKKHMGVSITDKGFTRDVLRLEIHGPKMYPLTVIDLPGFFYVETETQSLAGKIVVDQLVLDYMSKKESIILNVIAGNQPLANHDALSKVKAVDPSRDRTIGVITKPDLMVAKSESEVEYAKLVTKNEGANKLRLGWHVLRNHANVEADLDDRDAAELDFFKTGVWKDVPDPSLGISNLRKKLSRVLYDHIRKSLPEVIINIEKNLKERRTELAKLGPPRSDTDDRRSFLIKIASQFQSLAKDGVDGRYDDPFFGDLEHEHHKFRAQLRNFNRAFQHVLWSKGSSKLIHPDGQFVRPTEGPPEYLRRFLQKYPYDFPDPIITTESAVHLDLQRQASINQGKEFPGHSNKDLAIKLFQEQAKPWEEISRFHVKQVTFVAKAFVDAVFEHILGSADTNRTTEVILSTCVDPWFSDQEKILEEKLDELLQPYHDGYTVALDAEFHVALSKKSKGKIADRVYKILEQRQVLGTLHLDKAAITNAILEDTQLDGGEFGTQAAVDMMLAYYESARGTFAVNVINLAIERCLISGIPNIFTATKVSQMSKERLDELAAETDDIQNRREVLDSDIKALERAFSLCQRYRPRTVTTLPSTPPATSLASRPKSLNPEKPKSSIFTPGNATKSSNTSGSSAALFSMPDTWKSQIQSINKAENNK